MSRTTALVLVSLLSCASMACAKKPEAKEPTTTSAKMGGNVRPSSDLVRLCNLQFGEVERAPKFDYDQSSLVAEDRDILEQVAKCVTTGPLKGRRLSLVGRADPRGESEYNMVLGEHRAGSVADYLARLGVSSTSMEETSRGELDAEGSDEDTFRRDRRVDVLLQN